MGCRDREVDPGNAIGELQGGTELSKKLITLTTVLVVLLAGAATAGDLHYKVYGTAHVSTDMIDNGDESSIFVASNTSRVGIKGMYETDVDQLDVIFKYESWANFNDDEPGTNMFSTRDSWGGVRGDWGEVTWGRRNTPFKMTGYRAINIFRERIGDYRNATAYWGAAGANWDGRVDNSIYYLSPMLGEMVHVDLQYIPEEGMEDATFFSGSATYKKDGIYVSAAFETHGAGLEPAYGDVGPDDAESSTGIRAAARYDGERFMVGALYQTVSNVGGYDGYDLTVMGGAAQFAVAPMWLLKGHFFMMDPDMEGSEDIGGTLMAFGVDYVLSKRATLYVMYAMTSSDDNAYYTIGRGGHGQTYGWTGADGEQVGEGQTGLSVGLHATW
ncbi:porin [bacterium]|nr:porin [bacterium]